VFKSTKQYQDVGNLNTWLDVIWSLVVLEKADNEHLASVLSPDFISNLMKLKGKLNEDNSLLIQLLNSKLLPYGQILRLNIFNP
jgi:hypothetical protein